MAPNPSHSGYAPLPGADPESSAAPPKPINATALHVDALFRTWTRTIASRMKKRKKKKTLTEKDEEVEVMVSVFEPWKPEGQQELSKLSKGKGKEVDVRERTLDHEDPMTHDAFASLVRRVETAIEVGVHPRLNSKGSSGSYFARDARGTTLGIFKPSDEEPFGQMNPKFTKWVHRVFLSRVIPFGRACLIPGLSYASEAGASILDRRLDAHIVPRTEVAKLSSSAFFYDWMDRDRFKKGKARLPEKTGSFQVFLKGFQDASEFLRNHPYPGRPLSQTLDTSSHRQKRINFLAPFACLCGRADAENDDQSGWGWGAEDGGEFTRTAEARERFVWTEDTMVSFREELEKLVILDFLMRNTDRGLDNFMLKVCNCSSATTGAPPPAPPSTPLPTTTAPGPQSPMSEVRSSSSLPVTSPLPPTSSPRPPNATLPPSQSQKPHMHLAAIDNSLSFPRFHPRGWRSFTYGWLYLPISLIGQPFSQKTREHYLPLLSSPAWWAQTTKELRELFELDNDFREAEWNEQLALLKGQGYNIVQSLLDPEEGPLELCRRPKKLVVQEVIEVADDKLTRSLIAATNSSATATSTAGHPLPRPSSPPPSKPRGIPRSTSHPTPSRPVPLKRVSSDRSRPRATSTSSFRPGHGQARSFSSVISGAYLPEEHAGSITGVSLMQQLDRMEKAAARRSLSGGTSSPLHGETRELNDDLEEGDDEDDDGSDNYDWGVRSEGDLRQVPKPREKDRRHGGYTHVRGTHSVELDRGLVEGRRRSGSLTNMGGRPKSMGRHSLSELGGESRRSASWLEDFEEREEEPEEPVQRNQRKLVVIERLEPVDDKILWEW